MQWAQLTIASKRKRPVRALLEVEYGAAFAGHLVLLLVTGQQLQAHFAQHKHMRCLLVSAAGSHKHCHVSGFRLDSWALLLPVLSL